MRLPRRPFIDSSLALLAEGYAWLPDRHRSKGSPLVRTRLIGQPAVGLHGPEAVRFFYDEAHVERRTALPEHVNSTLVGHGGVHSLDGEAHRVRKDMLVSALSDPGSIGRLVDQVGTAWDEAAETWNGRSAVALFEEASKVIARGACRWAGVSTDGEPRPLAGDLVAMIDGFATPDLRHLRARTARRRREAWLAEAVRGIRDGTAGAPDGSAADAVARHRDAAGEPLSPRVAAVELLNLIRPMVEIAWLVVYAAHALLRWPEYRAALRAGDASFTSAFVNEVRRFYPFVPFVGGRAARDVSYLGEPIRAGSLVLLDLYGQHHDSALWTRPYAFDPRRFLDGTGRPDTLIPHGGGDVRAGHHCPGETVTLALLGALVTRLAHLGYDVPHQDLRIPLGRIPTRPRSGFLINAVRPSECD